VLNALVLMCPRRGSAALRRQLNQKARTRQSSLGEATREARQTSQKNVAGEGVRIDAPRPDQQIGRDSRQPAFPRCHFCDGHHNHPAIGWFIRTTTVGKTSIQRTGKSHEHHQKERDRCCQLRPLRIFNASAFAEFKPSAALQATCMPDVFRLCSSSLLSMDSVIACLREKKSQASAACQAKYDEESKAGEPKATAAK
jgi:hypothetical protein